MIGKLTAGQALGSFLLVMSVLAVWIYLQYLILVKIEATELMWLMFVCYIPLFLAATALSKLVFRAP